MTLPSASTIHSPTVVIASDSFSGVITGSAGLLHAETHNNAHRVKTILLNMNSLCLRSYQFIINLKSHVGLQASIERVLKNKDFS